jgi:hypothetical protein
VDGECDIRVGLLSKKVKFFDYGSVVPRILARRTIGIWVKNTHSWCAFGFASRREIEVLKN